MYGDQARQVRDAFEQVHKDQLRLDLHLAHGQKRLGDNGMSALNDLLAGRTAVKIGSRPVRCWSLSLFGIDLHDAWMLAPPNPRLNVSLRCRSNCPRRWRCSTRCRSFRRARACSIATG
nr:hypothetical protein [Pseudomonas sp. BIGb0427]